MRQLTPKEQLELFDAFGLVYVIETYIEQGFAFCDAAQIRFLDLPAPLTEDHILLYLEQGHQLCEKAELKLFDLRSYAPILEYYCFAQGHTMYPKGQLRLLDLPAKDSGFIKRFIRFNRKTSNLSPEFVQKAQTMGFIH